MTSASTSQIRFDGRVLFLSEDADVVESQLQGADVSLAEALPLRGDVSTDEITPASICWIEYADDPLS